MNYQKPLNDKDSQRLEKLYEDLKKASSSYSGYPSNLNYDYTPLLKFLSMSINNIGDPYESSNYHVNTHSFEKEVIDFFADILHTQSDYRGYVTNGGTEGNLYGLHLGCAHYPEGIIYYSENSHYSIEKIIRLMRVKSVKIESQYNGEIDYDDLYQQLKKNNAHPAILLLNIGTTMKGAIDNVELVKTQLNRCNQSNYYIHCDAALHGSFLPFIPNSPSFDFSTGIDSISISGHKFMGSPIPCGIAIAKYHYVKNISAKIAYVEISDSTISGSRNGITPLFLWYTIKRFGKSGFTKLTKQCLTLTNKVTKKMQSKGISAWHNEYSNIIVFPRPNDKLIKKWQIAVYNDIAHFIVMPHHTETFFDTILSEFKV